MLGNRLKITKTTGTDYCLKVSQPFTSHSTHQAIIIQHTEINHGGCSKSQKTCPGIPPALSSIWLTRQLQGSTCQFFVTIPAPRRHKAPYRVGTCPHWQIKQRGQQQEVYDDYLNDPLALNKGQQISSVSGQLFCN